MKYQEYLKASSEEEALQMLKSHPQNTLIVAGGTDVMVKARARDWYSQMDLLDISGVEEWKKIKLRDNVIKVGALVTISELLESEVIASKAKILQEACKSFAIPQIRNRATIGGNLANACLAADTIPALCVLMAEVETAGPSGQRRIPVSELLKNAPACLNHSEMAVSTCFYGIPAGKKTCLMPGEIITGVSIPVMDETYVTRFEKIGRKQAGCMSKFTLAAALHMENDRIADIRLSIGAAYAAIRLQSEFCDKLNGTVYEQKRIAEQAKMLGDIIEAQQKRPTLTILYKAEVCRRLVPRTLSEMREEAEHSLSCREERI